jgi:hypothetical protein
MSGRPANQESQSREKDGELVDHNDNFRGSFL